MLFRHARAKVLAAAVSVGSGGSLTSVASVTVANAAGGEGIAAG
jgi:hypothetical protein